MKYLFGVYLNLEVEGKDSDDAAQKLAEQIANGEHDEAFRAEWTLIDETELEDE